MSKCRHAWKPYGRRCCVDGVNSVYHFIISGIENLVSQNPVCIKLPVTQCDVDYIQQKFPTFLRLQS